MIRKEGGKYVVKSADGKKNLGSYDSKAEAKKRLAAVEYFKRQGKKK